MMELFDRIVDPNLLVRRINLAAACVMDEKRVERMTEHRQLDLFTDFLAEEERRRRENEEMRREKHMQRAMLEIRQRFGKNAILRGTNFLEGATGRDRNRQIGGHRA